ncbi:MAG: hypothetical protein CBD16_00700 [Betaproteobacteria bacterium TMED156]|nr:MAG: hypothetical protein CBD16_00700 [Betaproteobacteria bacterium TMED156]
MTNNPWRILGVTKYSTQEEIQSAYKKQAMQKHPDRGGSVKEFQELNQAYKELMGNKIPVLTKPTTKLVHVTLTIEQQVLGYKGMIECSTGEILDLNIPAGARVNDKFKVKSKGKEYIINIQEAEDELFTREGFNAILLHRVELEDVLLGKTITVPTPDGSEKQVKIKNVQKPITILGQGLYNKDKRKRGNLNVILRVNIPTFKNDQEVDKFIKRLKDE